ncbi:hypothetical protein [Kribbella sp. CA-247076]|uniref:hypothetical protein n=1 Tax=Kribbella sp. CA-247076 TaxID=3239941 RepID=UPI003D8E4E7C
MSEVQVVRGEMQPWTDRTTHQPAPAALLAEVIPANRRTLILGPHSPLVIEAVLEHSADVTILVRSVADGQRRAEEFGPCLQVITGALDGLTSVEPFDVVVAVDGLDRVLGYDSDDLSWSSRLSALAGLAGPSAVVVLGLANEFSLVNLLDSRQPHERHGDDEWRPLHDDPTRPVSVEQFAAALPWDAHVYAAFGSRALVSAEVAAAARPGELPTRLAVEALEAVDVPLLSPIADGVDTAARAGLLPAISTGWLAVCGVPTVHSLYAEIGPAVLTADKTPQGWQTALRTPADSATTNPPVASSAPDVPVARADVPVAAGDVASASADVASPSADVASAPADVASVLAASPRSTTLAFDAGVVPAEVPAGVSVEVLLTRLAAAEDVPGFRELAGRLGEWVTDSRVVVRWDDVVVDGESFAYGVSPWVTAEPTAKADLLAAAWCRFHERLIGQHRRHPWPPWMVGDDLVSAWLGMSGVDLPEPEPATSPDAPPVSTQQIARGKQIANELAEALATRAQASPDVRSVLAEAERAKQELFELKGHVFGLERTLGFRNKAMKTRENRIRELRTQLQKLTVDHDRIRGSRTYAVSRVIFHAAQIRRPHVVARKLSRRLRRR